jgi:antitoxin VapB
VIVVEWCPALAAVSASSRRMTSAARSMASNRARAAASGALRCCPQSRKVVMGRWNALESMLYIIGIRHEVTNMGRAKIFWSGRSQAVRLPKDFRFQGEEVRIRRHGNAVILEPMAEDWTWLDSIAGKLDEDFAQAVDERPEQQERPALAKLFR